MKTTKLTAEEWDKFSITITLGGQTTYFDRETQQSLVKLIEDYIRAAYEYGVDDGVEKSQLNIKKALGLVDDNDEDLVLIS